MKRFLFRTRDGQTPLPHEFHKGLKPKNIQTTGELDEYEERNLALGISWLERQKAGSSQMPFWMKLHRKLFGDVWDWAGKVRSHELQNEEYLPVHMIQSALKQLEGDLEYWLVQRKLKGEEILARFHERLLTIHPFPNGNGRFARILTEQVAKEHALALPSWGNNLAEDDHARRSAYVKALVQARAGNYSPLMDFMFH